MESDVLAYIGIGLLLMAVLLFVIGCIISTDDRPAIDTGMLMVVCAISALLLFTFALVLHYTEASDAKRVEEITKTIKHDPTVSKVLYIGPYEIEYVDDRGLWCKAYVEEVNNSWFVDQSYKTCRKYKP